MKKPKENIQRRWDQSLGWEPISMKEKSRRFNKYLRYLLIQSLKIFRENVIYS